MLLLFLEALIVGIITLIIGILFRLPFNYAYKHDMNDYIVLAFYFFVVGIITHLACEGVGLNKYYCNNGHACT
jgi:hypothetical protein